MMLNANLDDLLYTQFLVFNKELTTTLTLNAPRVRASLTKCIWHRMKVKEKEKDHYIGRERNDDYITNNGNDTKDNIKMYLQASHSALPSCGTFMLA